MPIDISNPVSAKLCFLKASAGQASQAKSDATSDGPVLTSLGSLSGSAINISKDDDGAFYVGHGDMHSQLPLAANENRKELTFSILGCIDFVGYIVTDTFEIGVLLNVLGINIGSFYGNADTGLVIKLDLVLISGTIRLYLHDAQTRDKSKTLAVNFTLTSPLVLGSNSVDQDVDIMSF